MLFSRRSCHYLTAHCARVVIGPCVHKRTPGCNCYTTQIPDSLIASAYYDLIIIRAVSVSCFTFQGARRMQGNERDEIAIYPRP